MTSLNKNVTVRFSDVGADAVKSQFRTLDDQGKKLAAQKFAPKVELNGAAKVSESMREISDKMREIGSKVARAKVDVQGDSAAKAKLIDIQLRLDKLNKMVTNPKITVDGEQRALAGILRVDAALDRLGHKKVNATVGLDRHGLEDGISDAIGEGLKGGTDIGTSLMDGLGGKFKVAAVTALVVGALALTPVMVAAAIGLGTGIGGIVIGAMGNKKFKNQLTSWWHGILGDLAKDVNPLIQALEGVQGAKGTPKNDVGASIVGSVKPALGILKELSNWIKSESGPLKQMFAASVPFIRMFADVLERSGKVIIPAFTGAMKQLTPYIPELTRDFTRLINLLPMFIKAIGPSIGPSVKDFTLLMNQSGTAIKVLGAVIGACARIFPLLDKAFTGPMNPLMHLTSLVVNSGNDFKQLGKDIQQFAHGAARDISQWVSDVVKFFTRLGSSIVSISKKFSSDVASIWDNIGSFAKHVFGTLETNVKRIWDDVWSWCKTRVKQFSSDVAGIWDNIVSFAKDVFGKLENGVKRIWDDLWSWAKTRVRQFSSDVASIWDGIFSFAKDVFNRLENGVKNIWNDTWHWARDRVSQFSSEVASIWDHLYNFAGNIFQRVKTNVEHIWDTMWGNLKHDGAAAVNWVVNNVLNPLGNIWNKVAGFIHAPKFPHIPTIGGHQNGGKIGYADGGKIPGQNRGDTHHILAESGEVVVPRRLVPSYSLSFKADGIPGFVNGGPVGAGAPSGGGPGPDQNVTKPTNGKAGSIGAAPGQGGANPVGSLGKATTVKHWSFSGFLKNIKNDVINAAFAPLTAIIDEGVKEATSMGGFAELVADAAKDLLARVISSMEGDASAVEGSASGQAIATYAKQFVGHRYVLGGSGDYQTNHNKPYGPWDCAGFVSQMYDHFGMGSPTAGINVTALRNWSHNQKDKKPTIGGMAFFKGADGTATHPGHVGLVTGANQSIQAMDEALGTRMADLSGALWYATPPGGFGGKGGYSGTGGTAIYSYLLNNVFDGHRIAATGALASIWGESGWNPESVGTGGNGIIGWTPPRPGIVTGNPTKDMAKQLPMVKQFIQQSGDEGVISEMMNAKTVLQAANEWGKGVERYGINDVHSAGINAAKAIAAKYGNGPSKPAPGTPTKKGPTSGPSPTTQHHLALGGMINEPVFGRGLRTGASYAIAENEPEYVTPMKNLGGAGGSGGNSYSISVYAGVGDPAKIGQAVVQYVTRYEQHQGKRGSKLTFH